MIYITHVHMGTAGTGHEHIADVRWKNPNTGTTGASSTATMVDFIDNKEGDARVQGPPDARVGTVTATPKHLRTYADKKWTNNLLDLPRY